MNTTRCSLFLCPSLKKSNPYPSLRNSPSQREPVRGGLAVRLSGAGAGVGNVAQPAGGRHLEHGGVFRAVQDGGVFQASGAEGGKRMGVEENAKRAAPLGEICATKTANSGRSMAGT